MRIELLTFDGCPNMRPTLDLVQEALRLEAVDAPIHVIGVDSPEAARHLRFLGSPSVRIDGDDVEPKAMQRTSYGIMCRTYDSSSSDAGVPPIEMIRAAIRRAL